MEYSSMIDDVRGDYENFFFSYKYFTHSTKYVLKTVLFYRNLFTWPYRNASVLEISNTLFD